MFDSFGIDINVKAMLRDLSVGQQQIVEIIKAVSISAKVVIMDEPTSSLSIQETKTLFEIIKTLKKRGVSVVFITHRMDEIYEICDRMTILRDGYYVGTWNVNELNKSMLIEKMIGRELTQQYPPRKAKIGSVVLQVKNLDDGGSYVKDVSFSVRAGEVLGFAGLVGARRTETMRLIFGADKLHSGQILIDGKEVKIRNPRNAIRNRIGFLTEDRKQEGLFLRFPVRVNTTIVKPEKILGRLGIFFDFKKEKKVAEEFVKVMRTATPSINQKVMFLSGGNQQKVVLSKWLFSDSKIFIFDEPTRGIDVGAKYEIYDIINKLAEEGHAIIVVSSDMEEIMGISDRILIMHEGRISGQVYKEEFSQNLIMKYAVGEK